MLVFFVGFFFFFFTNHFLRWCKKQNTSELVSVYALDHHALCFQNVTVATTEHSVHSLVERGVREVHVTPLTVPVSVYLDGNHQRVTQVRLNSSSHYDNF